MNDLMIYMSYEEEDDSLGNRFKKLYNRQLREIYHATIWSMQDVPDGAFTQEVMGKQMAQSSIFLLLISPDYLASPRCLAELTAAQWLWKEDRIWIIPVLLRPTDVENDHLNKLQMIPRKTGNSVLPLTSWNSRDEAWGEVYRSVKNIIETFGTKRLDG